MRYVIALWLVPLLQTGEKAVRERTLRNGAEPSVLVLGLTWKVLFAHPESEYSRPGGAQLGHRSVSS